MSLKNTFSSISKLMEDPIIKNMRITEKNSELVFVPNPGHKTNKTIEELKDIIVEQLSATEKQAKNTKRLTYLALVFAFISIVPVIREYIPIFQPKKDDRDIYELENKVLLQSNTTLENQVRILKVENELLKTKKTFEKEKKLP